LASRSNAAAGFKNLNQAQLLSDVLYYPNSLDAQQWLVYYISKPLVGSLESIKITPATLPGIYAGIRPSRSTDNELSSSAADSGPSSKRKKDVKSFNELLNNFPMIARQMQSGLERVFKDFNRDMSGRAAMARPQPSSKPLRRPSASSSRSGSSGSIHSRFTNGHAKAPSIATLRVDEEEDYLRRALETAVTATIDLFQLVDKQQLSFLGTSTDLTGPVVERLIERYVTEQLHDSSIFPLLCNSRNLDDLELESRIHQMEHIDIAQVGIEIEDGRKGKEQLMKRLDIGVDEFRKLGVAGSPQEMVDILLSTQKLIANNEPIPDEAMRHLIADYDRAVSEKPKSAMTMNADTLVSLLLVVVIRSQVRHLQARLTYMRNFIFIDDVDGGETGYALSTFEAVLSYLVTDSGGLRKASKRNRRLWQATRTGALSEIKAILETDQGSSRDPEVSTMHNDSDEDALTDEVLYNAQNGQKCVNGNSMNGEDQMSQASTEVEPISESSTLAHVFPFQANSNSMNVNTSLARKVKRVSMDVRSLSISSDFSFKSRTTTIDSRACGIEGDLSIAILSQTQDSAGDSVLMMAVEAKQPKVLSYLLTLEEFYPTKFIFEDSNKEGTTLLSAAVQLANTELVEIILQYVLQTRDKQAIMGYLTRADIRGRTVAHYLFNATYLISRFGNILPWRLKDKNGQTPLLALCRSYDHSEYSEMVNDALHFSTLEQDDGQPLHMDDHVDAKGNTLLHVVSDPSLAVRILRLCDSDANAANDKRFTPLMVASKYGRVDMIRAFFGDKRVDISAKELRGMTAVELAKDDEVRNRIDDMVLVSNVPAADGRVTAVVRSFFVEDASIRLIIKSAVRNANGMIGVTTCRRSLTDFENLAKWLSVEHPASWLPSIFNLRSPFQFPSRPSRAALQDIQVRLDRFLKIMLAHSTFSTHELLWEFILFPEIQPEMMAERSRKKAAIRIEKVKEEYEPIEDVRDVELFVEHARESIRGVNHSTRSIVRRVTNIHNTTSGMHDLMGLFLVC
jgi:ankyrin repeat protein